jgi:hypothetical protein
MLASWCACAAPPIGWLRSESKPVVLPPPLPLPLPLPLPHSHFYSRSRSRPRCSRSRLALVGVLRCTNRMPHPPPHRVRMTKSESAPIVVLNNVLATAKKATKLLTDCLLPAREVRVCHQPNSSVRPIPRSHPPHTHTPPFTQAPHPPLAPLTPFERHFSLAQLPSTPPLPCSPSSPPPAQRRSGAGTHNSGRWHLSTAVTVPVQQGVRPPSNGPERVLDLCRLPWAVLPPAAGRAVTVPAGTRAAFVCVRVRSCACVCMCVLV